MEFDLDRIGGPKALDALLDEILAAGKLALGLMAQGAADRARLKADSSPVTEADEAVEHRLKAYVAQHFPGASFVGEETGQSSSQDQATELRFIVDPIDGTRAFVRGLPTWSVLVAVEFQGVPVIGIGWMPQAEDLIVAVRGHGVHVNGRPAELSKTSALDRSLVAHGGLGQFAEAGMIGMLEQLAVKTHTQRGFADFANYRELLLGRADGVIDTGLRIWDIAPVVVMVNEAGGRVSTFAGAEALQDGHWIASNGALHDQLLALTGSR